MDLRNALDGQRWDEVPTAFLDLTCSPALLSADAFLAFLPLTCFEAWMNGERVVLEFTVYCLCPSTINRESSPSAKQRLEERAALMTPVQVQAIRSFVLFVVSCAKNGERFKRGVDLALDSIWR